MDEIDIKILKYVVNNNNIHIDKILKKFPNNKYSTLYRIELLSTEEKGCLELNYEDIDDGYGVTISKSLNTYSITDKGKVEIQTYCSNIKNLRINTFKYSFLYPILVALITAILTTFALNKLQPWL